jgi:SAM-dependent methyltransferase
MRTKDVTTANLDAWDEAAPLHRRQNMARLKEAFSSPGYSCLNEIETDLLRLVDVTGKDVAQLCCNNGRELLSAKNMGAGRCVGFDGSEKFVAQARELADASGIECSFVCTDIYDVDTSHDGAFDLIVVTIGVLTWMPDLDGFFQVAERLLKAGGAMLVYEQHPILGMFEPGEKGDPIVWELSYFERNAYVETGGLDYYGGGTYRSKPLYSYIHKTSDIIMAGVKLKFAVEHFEERPEHISNTWYNLEDREHQLPMSFTLVFRKPLETQTDGR